MVRHVDCDAGIWRFTFVLCGAGSTFVGPFLPSLSTTWHLTDSHAGLLVSAFFLGSFLGTLLLSNHLRRTLNIGASMACIGLLLFSRTLGYSSGFPFAIIALAITGFGLGQLMSSINLLVGCAESARRAGSLASIAAAWCLGAVLSPTLTTVIITSLTPQLRLALFAALFITPALWSSGRPLPTRPVSQQNPTTMDSRVSTTWRPAILCVIMFLVYGGVEASISAWMPMFATRYRLGTLGKAQWIVSLFWIGLGSSRVVIDRFIAIKREDQATRIFLFVAAVSLFCLVVVPSRFGLLAGCLLAGFSLGPIFPLILSSSIGLGLSSRSLGIALAACGLGSAIFPYFLGLISSAGSLQNGMAVPVIGLVILIALAGKISRNQIDVLHFHSN